MTRHLIICTVQGGNSFWLFCIGFVLLLFLSFSHLQRKETGNLKRDAKQLCWTKLVVANIKRCWAAVSPPFLFFFLFFFHLLFLCSPFFVTSGPVMLCMDVCMKRLPAGSLFILSFRTTTSTRELENMCLISQSPSPHYVAKTYEVRHSTTSKGRQG